MGNEITREQKEQIELDNAKIEVANAQKNWKEQQKALKTWREEMDRDIVELQKSMLGIKSQLVKQELEDLKRRNKRQAELIELCRMSNERRRSQVEEITGTVAMTFQAIQGSREPLEEDSEVAKTSDASEPESSGMSAQEYCNVYLTR